MKKSMGFLDRLWDETLAGPAPDKSLGKLRKHKSLSAVRSPDHPIVTTTRRDDDDQTVPVSRSITILRNKSLTVDPDSGSGSAASSPSSYSSPSSGPSSPFSPGKSPDLKRRMMRKYPTFKPSQHAEPTSPVYDWIMISALDR